MSARDFDKVLKLIDAIPLQNGRRIIAVAGAPASGKSTLAEDLSNRIPNSCVIPMDGFHRDNDDLERNGLLARKGSAETFDVAGFGAVIRSVRTSKDMKFPTFDRANDCVVPGGGAVTASDQTIVVEGNYLLLDVSPWKELAREWDFSIMLDVPMSVLRNRLVDRWLQNGHDAVAALARAESNDLPNARLLIRNALPADFTLTL